MITERQNPSQVSARQFRSSLEPASLRRGLQHAIISENNGVKGVEIANEIGERAVLVNNEPPPKAAN